MLVKAIGTTCLRMNVVYLTGRFHRTPNHMTFHQETSIWKGFFCKGKEYFSYNIVPSDTGYL